MQRNNHQCGVPQTQQPPCAQEPQPCMEACPQESHGRRHHSKPYPRRSGARLTAYLLVAVLLNILLAFFALYVVGTANQFSADLLSAGVNATLTERVYEILLLLSPLFLTVLLNKLLYMGMRGRHHRFPRWVPPVVWLLVITVQALTVLFILGQFASPAGDMFSVDTLTTLIP